MKLSKVVVKNFGIYKGINKLDFDVVKNKNVVLILGENGSGKTTLLDSIKIGLYGPLYYGYSSNETNKYLDEIHFKINQHAIRNKEKEAYAQLEFTFNEGSIINNYTIKRSWNLIDKNIKEKLEITKNGRANNNEQAKEILRKLHIMLPIKLFDLFWFDGEKIDRLFSLKEDLPNMISSVFNLDVLMTLNKDLRTFIKNRTSHNNYKKVIEDSEKTDEKIKEVEILIEEINNKINDLKNEQTELLDKDLMLKNKLKSIVGKANGDIGDLTKKRDSLVNKKDEIRHKNERLILEELPLLIVRSKLCGLCEQLDNEKKYFENEIFEKKLKEYQKIYKDYSIEIDKLLNIINENEERRFNINPYEYRSIVDKIKKISDINPLIINENMQQIDKLTSKIQKTNKEISLKESDEVNDLIIQKESIQKNIGRLDELISLNNDDKKSAIMELEGLRKHQEALQKHIRELSKDKNLEKVINNINNTITTYTEFIKTKKMKELNTHVTEMFQIIIRKDDFIESVEISQEGDIILYNKTENKISKNSLSAGEKQILILSIIYGLIKVAGLKIPVVFDTLLGRLDQKHKENIIKKYLPRISDQIIILATDSEVDSKYAKIIDLFTNKFYKLDLNSYENKVTIKDFYNVVV